MASGGTKGKSGSRNGVSAVEEKTQPSAMGAQDVQELIDYMKTNYGFKMYKQDLKDGDFEAVKEQVSALEEVIQEFPGAKDSFKSFRVTEYVVNDKNATFAESSAGSISLNTKFFSNKDVAESYYKKSVSTKFHPEGTTSKHITSHEAGHILEEALANKYLPGNKNWAARIHALDSGRFADEVIRQAVNKIGSSLKMTKSELREQVSRYAMKNMRETMAECVADYMANKSKAKPLSKAVHEILKQELG